MGKNATAKLIILVGPPGSGKTHFASQFCSNNHFKHINNDQARYKFFPRPVFTDQERTELYVKLYQLILEELQKNNSIVFDGNILTNYERRKVVAFFQSHIGITPFFVVIEAPSDLALSRAMSREQTPDLLYHPVPAERAMRLHEQFEPIANDLPSVIIQSSDSFEHQEKIVLSSLGL
ncbi:MAG: ATP-binding protein [Patescibacteria group bacterium]